MNLRDFLRVMRTRWLIIVSATAVAVLATVAVMLLTTPLYQASTRLFVSTSNTSSGDASQIYEGTLSSQQRVLSYTKLLTDGTLAQRTIDKLHLDMTAEALQKEIKATAPSNTVLIDVSVLDPSPVKARDIADALSDEFVVMVAELETPPDGKMPNARVVVERHALLPIKPVIPKTTRDLALGGALGMLLGIGRAVLRDRLDNTVKDQRVLEEIAGVGLVASIPLDKERPGEPAITFADNRSAVAEAFREVRTNLQFLEVDDPPRVLLVTSALPNEGKTTTAINIALALAEAGHKVVLVDGDLRRPGVQAYLDMIGQVGLSTVLAGRASVDEVLQTTRFPGLTVLTSGVTPPNPSELLGSLATKKLIIELRSRFDYVVVDSSPLLPVTDAVILSTAVDGVLVIARFSKTKSEQLASAIGNLRNVGARILGTILAIVPARSNDSLYYGYYGAVERPSSTSPKTPPRGEKLRRHRRSNAANRPST